MAIFLLIAGDIGYSKFELAEFYLKYRNLILIRLSYLFTNEGDCRFKKNILVGRMK